MFDPGSLFDTALVQAGAGGPILTVVSVDSPNQVTLQNDTGLSVEAAAGTRLILLSARPTAYADPLAVGPSLGSTVTADSGGHAVVYLTAGQYDYIVTDPAESVTLDTASQSVISGAVASLSISHTVTSGQDLLLVAIAWQEPLATDTLDSVAWNGTPMTHMGSSQLVDLYGLADPETGTHNVVATWSGSNTKAAVGEAIGVTSRSEIGLPKVTNQC